MGGTQLVTEGRMEGFEIKLPFGSWVSKNEDTKESDSIKFNDIWPLLGFEEEAEHVNGENQANIQRGDGEKNIHKTVKSPKVKVRHSSNLLKIAEGGSSSDSKNGKIGKRLSEEIDEISCLTELKIANIEIIVDLKLEQVELLNEIRNYSTEFPLPVKLHEIQLISGVKIAKVVIVNVDQINKTDLKCEANETVVNGEIKTTQHDNKAFQKKTTLFKESLNNSIQKKTDGEQKPIERMEKAVVPDEKKGEQKDLRSLQHTIDVSNENTFSIDKKITAIEKKGNVTEEITENKQELIEITPVTKQEHLKETQMSPRIDLRSPDPTIERFDLVTNEPETKHEGIILPISFKEKPSADMLQKKAIATKALEVKLKPNCFKPRIPLEDELKSPPVQTDDQGITENADGMENNQKRFSWPKSVKKKALPEVANNEEILPKLPPVKLRPNCFKKAKQEVKNATIEVISEVKFETGELIDKMIFDKREAKVYEIEMEIVNKAIINEVKIKEAFIIPLVIETIDKTKNSDKVTITPSVCMKQDINTSINNTELLEEKSIDAPKQSDSLSENKSSNIKQKDYSAENTFSQEGKSNDSKNTKHYATEIK